jgi:hypothetical protein
LSFGFREEEIAMFKWLALPLLGALALFPSSAKADGPQHQRYHGNLEHRDYHRHLEHRDAHRHPMTWRQHGRLHDSLDHDAYHDRLEHRQYHGRYDYLPLNGYGYGFGYQGRNFSFWIGR